MRATALSLALLLTGCALPLCEMPSATKFETPRGDFLVFDGPNIERLDALLTGMSQGTCRPAHGPEEADESRKPRT